MLLFFLFFPCGLFIQFFFHRQGCACGEADHRTEVLGGDLRLHAPPLFLGVLILVHQCPRSGQSGHGGHQRNRLLERVGNLSEKYSSKWIDWLPDFSLLVALKWVMLVLILGTAALAGWYGAAAIRGLFL